MPNLNTRSNLEPLFQAILRTSQVEVYVDAIKYVADSTVFNPLYEEIELSADNANSTLQIVKEQQPIKAGKPQYLADTVVCQLLNELMVEDDGIEPTTPCLQSRCSPS